MAAEAGMIGLAMANDAPSMTIPGALGRILGNNPFAVAIPAGELVVMLDIAMSTVAGGKVMAAHALGERIPDTWCLDVHGRATTNPADFPAGGALTPMAGHKGYGLALMVESLCAVLTGAHLASQVRSWILDDPALATGHGAAFLAVDISAMTTPESFAARMHELATQMRAAPLRAGCERIYLPGEIEHERRSRALREGIHLPRDVAQGIRELAGALTLDISTLFNDVHDTRPSPGSAP
jgi:ureidoglycolate dehydrogenase (NAD+)